MESTTNVKGAVGNVRSRRALLGGVLGGVGAWAANAISRHVSPAEAVAGDPMRIGRANNAGVADTRLDTTSDGSAFTVRQHGPGRAIKVESGKGRGTAIESEGMIDAWAFRTAMSATSRYGTAIHALSELKGPAIVAVAPNNMAVKAVSDHHTGVYAVSEFGNALVARHQRGPGWAGVFDRNVFIKGYCTFGSAHPASPAGASLFVRNNGSGKSELCVQFATGPVQVLATEP